jgi:serine/threonine-protein kinase
VAAVLVAATLVAGAIVLAGNRDTNQTDPRESPTALPTEPTFPTSRSPASPTTAARSPTASPRVPSTYAPSLPPPTAPQYWSATIVGTCDEGGSCGLKQRTAPYIEAPRMYPNDLQDGTTVIITCQTIGDARTSGGHGTSHVWYRLVNGAYINLVYTTLKAPLGMPTC